MPGNNPETLQGTRRRQFLINACDACTTTTVTTPRYIAYMYLIYLYTYATVRAVIFIIFKAIEIFLRTKRVRHVYDTNKYMFYNDFYVLNQIPMEQKCSKLIIISEVNSTLFINRSYTSVIRKKSLENKK